MTMTAAHRRATAVLRGEDLPVVEMECDEDGLAHRALAAALNDPDDDVIARTLCRVEPGGLVCIYHRHQADEVRAAILGPSRG